MRLNCSRVSPLDFAKATILRELNSQSLQIHALHWEQYFTCFSLSSSKVSLHTSQIPFTQEFSGISDLCIDNRVDLDF